MSDINHRATRIDMDQVNTPTAARPATAAAPTAETGVSVGLHGAPLGINMARVTLAEAVGTFMLVLTICSVAVGAALARPVAGIPYGSLAVPLAGGAVLAIVASSLGHISGAHLNPAVTIGLAANRKFPWSYVPAYIVAQFAGAIAAAAAVWGFYGAQARSVAHLAATSPAAGVGTWRAFSVEAVVTFILVLVIISVATDKRVPAGVAPLAIGAALAAAIFISGPVSGAGVNPARAIGPMIVANRFGDWWIYLVAPLLGGLAAATLYHGVLQPAETP